LEFLDVYRHTLATAWLISLLQGPWNCIFQISEYVRVAKTHIWSQRISQTGSQELSVFLSMVVSVVDKSPMEPAWRLINTHGAFCAELQPTSQT
jgi:hypothetical protein